MKKTIVFKAVIAILLTVFPVISLAAPPDSWNFSVTPDNYRGVAYGNGQYVAVGDQIVTFTKRDGINWTINNVVKPVNELNGITYGMNRFVAVGDSETIYTSLDGNTWTPLLLGGNYKLKGVAYGNGTFMAIGDDTGAATPKNLRIFISKDGQNWTYSQFPVYSGSFAGIAYGNGRFVAIANGYYTGPGSNKLVHFTSTNNGTSWTTDESSFFTSTLFGITYGNGEFIAINQNSFFKFTNMTIWTVGGLMGFSDIARAISFGNGYFVVVASMGEIRYSSDLLTWNTGNITAHPLSAVTYGGGGDTIFVAVGNGEYAISNQTGNLLTVNIGGDIESGGVLSNPAGIACPSYNQYRSRGEGYEYICEAYYDKDTIVTLDAISNPSSAYYFYGWSGAECTDNVPLTCKVKMGTAKTITANFSATPPASGTWAKTYGSENADSIDGIQPLADGGYVGVTSLSTATTGVDMAILKIDSLGNPIKQITLNGPDLDRGFSIKKTWDGGYVVTGVTGSFGGTRLWVLKFNQDDLISWQKTYGDAAQGYSIQETSDGGFILTGKSSVTGAWVLKLDSNGNTVWHKAFNSLADFGYSIDGGYLIQQTGDGGYILTGETHWPGPGFTSVWVAKLNEDGTVAWQKAYGTALLQEYGYSIQQTFDGGYILTGSIQFEITPPGGPRILKVLVIKLFPDGTIEWAGTYGGTNDDFGISVQQNSDGGYIVLGQTKSYGSGGQDIWIIRLNEGGDIIWQKAYGGSSDDIAYSIQQTGDGGYIVAGQTSSVGSNGDGLILKLDSDGNLSGCAGISIVTTTAVKGIAPNLIFTSGDPQVPGVDLTVGSPSRDMGTYPYEFTPSSICSGLCSYSLSLGAQNNIPSDGGVYTVDIYPSDNSCVWTATENASWIAITSGPGGTGLGTVEYTVDPNPGPTRYHDMQIAENVFRVTQLGGCTFNLLPASYGFLSLGGSSSVYVETSAPGCVWTANSSSWITLTGGSGIGSGIIAYEVGINSGGTPRTGDISIGGISVAINQEGFVGDSDGDGIPDDQDNCPNVPNGPLEGTCFLGRTNCANNSMCTAKAGDFCIKDQRDSDGDGIGDTCDNCPSVYNPDQAHTNPLYFVDGIGDACRSDPITPDLGLAPKNNPPAAPAVTYPDTDNDGFADNVDTCFNIPNAGQTLPLCYKDLDGDHYSDGITAQVIVTNITKTDSSNGSSYTGKRCDCPANYYLSRQVDPNSALIATTGDCNDNDLAYHPGAPEPAVPDGHDYDCNPNTPDLVNPYYLKFIMDGNWLPAPGSTIVVTAQVIDQIGNPHNGNFYLWPPPDFPQSRSIYQRYDTRGLFGYQRELPIRRHTLPGGVDRHLSGSQS